MVHGTEGSALSSAAPARSSGGRPSLRGAGRGLVRAAILTCALAPAALGGGIASAQTAAPPAAAEAPAPRTTRLQLTATASREVEQDLLVVTMTARVGAAAPREAQAAVNASMTAALDLVTAVDGLRRASGAYRVWQERDRNGQPRGWVAEQDLKLTSRDAGPLLEVAGQLQAKGLVMSGLGYELSPEARKALEESLMAEALSDLRTKAERAAATMSMRVESYASVRLGGVGRGPQPRAYRMAAAAEAAPAAPPVALPDLEQVTFEVEAEIVLALR